LRMIQCVQIMPLPQSTNSASNPVSMSCIYDLSSPKRGGRFPNSQSTHCTTTSDSSLLLVHQHTHTVVFCVILPPTASIVIHCRSFLPRMQLSSVRYLYPLPQQLSFTGLSFSFYLLILTPEILRPALHRCSYPKKCLFLCMI